MGLSLPLGFIILEKRPGNLDAASTAGCVGLDIRKIILGLFPRRMGALGILTLLKYLFDALTNESVHLNCIACT